MKRRMLQDVMGSYRLPLLSEAREVLEFQIDQARYFVEKMKRHEAQFQNNFTRDDEKGASKQRIRYIYNFAAYLNAARVFVYLLRRLTKPMPEASAWAKGMTSTQPFRAFQIMRDANTHRVPLHYSLTYNVNAQVTIPLRGVLPSRINLNLLPHMVVDGPPWITLDLTRVHVTSGTDLSELVGFVSADQRRTSITYMCEEFLGAMEAAEHAARRFLENRAHPATEVCDKASTTDD